MTDEEHAPAPSIRQQGQNNIAQIGSNNQATINALPPPRRLSEGQKEKMRNVLALSSHNITIASLVGEDEAAFLAISIADVFEKAGWKVERVIGRQMLTGYSPEAITLSLYAPQGATSVENETARMTVDALTGAGLRVAINPDPTMQPTVVNLYVGARRPDESK